MSVRAKFKVQSVTKHIGWANNGPREVHTIRLNPVVGDSDENKAFYDATPSGSIELSVVRQEIGDRFPIGAEFYVDFTLAGG